MTTAEADLRRPLNRLVTASWTRLAAGYDFPPLQTMMYRPPQDEVIAALRIAGARRIADIACGTGILAARIADELSPEQVYGIDMSEGMLARAKERSAKVEWRLEPAERTTFPDGALDAVVTTSAFHFFNQAAALAEFRRVVRPGGLVAVVAVVAPFMAATGPAASSPSVGALREMISAAGLELVSQRKIPRPLPDWLTPDLLSLAQRPR